MKVKKEIYICPKCGKPHENLAVLSYNSGIKPMAESAQKISQEKITKCEHCKTELQLKKHEGLTTSSIH